MLAFTVVVVQNAAPKCLTAWNANPGFYLRSNVGNSPRFFMLFQVKQAEKTGNYLQLLLTLIWLHLLAFSL